MSIQVRQRIEKQILVATLDALLAAPRKFVFGVDIGEGEEGDRTRDKAKLIELANAGDECTLFVCDSHDGPDQAWGWVKFVWGNSGWDCLSDYTVNLEPIISPITGNGGLQDKLNEEYGDQ